MADVLIEDLVKSYGGVRVLDGVDLYVRDGEVMVILGPTGCGKTTLLRVVAGLEKPDSGIVKIGGRVVNELPPRERNVAMVFQSYALYPHMKARQNIGFPLLVRRRPKKEIDERVKEIAKILRIEPEDLLERYPWELSMGEKQKVAIGRALIRQPDVLLMDEPLSNLDAKQRVEVRVEIKKLLMQFKVTTIYVTHDQIEGCTIGDRIAIMNRGRIEQVGDPMYVYRYPKTPFVKEFFCRTLDAYRSTLTNIVSEG